MKIDQATSPGAPERQPDSVRGTASEEAIKSGTAITSIDQRREFSDEPVLVVPVLEEELVIERRPVTLGSVHVHQRVETHDALVQASTAHEHVTLEHVPASAYDPIGPKDPDVVEVIPIVEEQLVVTKRQVVVEYVLVRKTQTLEWQDVRDTVRRTVVDIDQDSGDGAHPR